jgi:hypothetical protein
LAGRQNTETPKTMQEGYENELFGGSIHEHELQTEFIDP